MNNLIKEIKTKAKSQKVKVYFDMDGTLAEYDAEDKEKILSNQAGVYLTKRPLKSIINVADKLAKIDNIEICIASNCHFKEQKEEKLLWLEKHTPFIKKENINIIVFDDMIFSKEEKDFLKANLIISNLKQNEFSYLIEDDHKIIRATNKFSNIKACHMSMFVN